MLGFISKRYFSLNRVLNKQKQVCIVGAGPAGFYAAQYLVKHLNDVQVDLIERLPVPFGLVRYGVAPDHPEVKNVINTFTKTAEHPNVRFLGNIELGKDVSLKALQQCYNAVLLTYGAEQDKTLGIPGEDFNNIVSAREFVGWYNGDPKCKDLKPNLKDHVLVLGQGNVAMDVARIILTPVDQLKVTDITTHALEALSTSKVRKVSLVGRRGPLQAAFTIKELREMLKIPKCNTIWRSQDFIDISDDVVASLARPKKRITELMLKSVKENAKTEGFKEFCPIFYCSPVLFKANEAEFVVNIMEADKAIATSNKESIKYDYALRSIGYKSVCADPDINFDLAKGYVKNVNGRVLDNNGDISPGLYVGGWLRTGPTGVILTTMSNAFEVAENICKDFMEMQNVEHKSGFQGLNIHNYITWKDWQKIDKVELSNGKALGKCREKLLNIQEMLEICY